MAADEQAGGNAQQKPVNSIFDMLEEPPKEPKEVEEEERDTEAWMVTFSDLITLMMTFFVLLYSFKDPTPPAEGLATNSKTGVFQSIPANPFESVKLISANSYSRESLEIFLSDNAIQDVQIEETLEGAVITLPADIHFEPKSSKLNPTAIVEIKKIAHYLNKTQHEIRIEGHTDNQFEESPRHMDSWTLSLARAKAVLDVFIQAGVAPERFGIVGKGKFFPKVPNDTPKSRQANRRVDIVLLNESIQPQLF